MRRKSLFVMGGLALSLCIVAGGVYAWKQGTSQLPSASLGGAELGSPAHCAVYGGIPDGFGVVAHAGMTKVPGGNFELGAAHGYPDERPAGIVKVQPFWIDRTEVTNAQFAAFVEATGYRTSAEREGAAAVFRAPQKGQPPAQRPMAWWTFVEGASWRHPDGPGSSIEGLDNQPVTQIALEDALAYAKWLGRDLPTEAEWEWAARAGGDAETLEREPRGPDGTPLANFWQGIFPDVDAREDGYAGRAPAGCFPANGWGIHDMIGNVWEWTNDHYRGPHRPPRSGDLSADLAADMKAARPAVRPGTM